MTPPDGEPSPNFVVLVADDMRWDAMGVAGNRIVLTPNLDALAAEGTLFTNNFTTTPICPTSRASILTGQYARRHGIWDFHKPLSSEQLRLSYPNLLRRAGYQTAFIGKWGTGDGAGLPESEFDYWRGFEGQGEYFDSTGGRTGHLTGYMGGQALEFLESADDDRPFCLSISFKAPHGPWRPDPKFSHLYEDVAIPQPATSTDEHFERLPVVIRSSQGREGWRGRFSTDELYQRNVRQYYRLITGMDEVIGDLVGHLKQGKQYDRTCLLFTSDHGLFLGEHGLAGKWQGYEPSIRTPLIIKPVEGSVNHGVSAMTLNCDLCPTLLELAGLKAPESVQGQSLVPLLTGRSESVRHEWFYEHFFEHPRIAKCEGIRTDRYKYLTFIEEEQEGELLFDLDNDPLEETNLIRSGEHQALLASMRQKVARMRVDLE